MSYRYLTRFEDKVVLVLTLICVWAISYHLYVWQDRFLMFGLTYYLGWMVRDSRQEVRKEMSLFEQLQQKCPNIRTKPRVTYSNGQWHCRFGKQMYHAKTRRLIFTYVNREYRERITGSVRAVKYTAVDDPCRRTA